MARIRFTDRFSPRIKNEESRSHCYDAETNGPDVVFKLSPKWQNRFNELFSPFAEVHGVGPRASF